MPNCFKCTLRGTPSSSSGHYALLMTHKFLSHVVLVMHFCIITSFPGERTLSLCSLLGIWGMLPQHFPIGGEQNSDSVFTQTGGLFFNTLCEKQTTWSSRGISSHIENQQAWCAGYKQWQIYAAERKARSALGKEHFQGYCYLLERSFSTAPCYNRGICLF